MIRRLLGRFLSRFRDHPPAEAAHPATHASALADGFDRAVDDRGAENQSFEDLGQIGSGTRFI
jgi:hypothetical protein